MAVGILLFNCGYFLYREDLEELVLCKEEIQQLKCTLKTLKQQYQKLDDALLQEQVEKQELEKLKDAEVNR